MSQKALLLTRDGVEGVQRALGEAGLDGWLLFEFHGQNPIAQALLGLEWTTRRGFVLVPTHGVPTALIHAIEGSSWRDWPWEKRSYAGWREMEEGIRDMIGDRRRLAMEVSPRSAVPTLDRVPSGIVDLVRETGCEPVSSGNLVSAFYSVWSARQLEVHRSTALTIAQVAREAFTLAAEGVRASMERTEGELASWIRSELASRGVGTDVDCIVAIGPTASDPHYAPGDRGERIGKGALLLIDLWGKPGSDDVPADQTWMGHLGSSVPPDVVPIWEAVRDARDAAVEFLRDRARSGQAVRGYEVDDVCRALIAARGFGDQFVHRTGHSIDRELHGSGPNLDNLETRDDRLLIPGVGFSVEPGIYVPGVVGVRSELNVHWTADGPEVTTPNPQREIFPLLDD